MEAVLIKDSLAVEGRVRDSLQVLFMQAVSQLNDKRSDVDSLKGQLDNQVAHIFKLRNEIGSILKNRNVTKADLNLAKQKIAELQGHIDEMKEQNVTLEEERSRLNVTLEQLSTEMKTMQESITRLGAENKELAETINEASTFVASEIKLVPMDVREGVKEVETSKADKANKFVISFFVQNNITKASSTDVIVVITEPDGKTMKSSIWESGNFNARTEGMIDYTIRFNIEYRKGEQKKMLFSLQPEKIQKGTYTMQVYHNGVMIGETAKKLS